MMDLERRRSARLSTSIPVGLRFSAGAFQEGWGRILNLSPEGLLLETLFPLHVAQVVYVSFALHGGAHFNNLRTHVIRLNTQEGYATAAIAFDEVVDHETLRDVLSALAYEGGLTIS